MFRPIVIIGVMVIVLIGLYLSSFYFFKPNKEVVFGVSFNTAYAKSLGLDPKEVLKTIFDDWKFKYVRFSAQWDLIEIKKGIYNFSDLDWQMEMAKSRGAKITLAVGRKTPRWPECHLPVWAQKMKYEEYKLSLRSFINVVVERYKNNQALEIWQVENEPFVSFGLCKKMSLTDLREEVVLVKAIDKNHQIMVTDSGELSWWGSSAKVADLFGTTMYRVVWNKYMGYFSYRWMPAWVYRFKLWLAGREITGAFVSELQAEPWLPNNSALTTPVAEQMKSMSLKQLEKNIDYAKRVGFSRAYLWGAEWWYWMNEYGNGRYVERVKGLRR